MKCRIFHGLLALYFACYGCSAMFRIIDGERAWWWIIMIPVSGTFLGMSLKWVLDPEP